MNDIKVTSKIDLKTYYSIAMRNFFKSRIIIFIILVIGALSYTILSGSYTTWDSYMYLFGIILIYAILIPTLIYVACRKNIKRAAVLNENLLYTLNENKIERKGETVNLTTGWQYISKMIEREKYLLLMTQTKTFYYLPKDGFENREEIVRFKDIVKGKGIKMTYH
jgi:hypothetical protein